MSSHRTAALALALLFAAGGCRGCFCTNATKSLRETAPEDVVKEEAKKEIEKAPAKASTICGIDVSALKDVVVTVVKSEWARHEVKIEGTAVPRSGAAPAADEGDEEEDDASTEGGAKVVVSPAKALLCTGIFVLTMDPVLDDHGVRTAWKVTSFEVDAVHTPGVTFDKSTHRSHHRRRHHHH